MLLYVARSRSKALVKLLVIDLAVLASGTVESRSRNILRDRWQSVRETLETLRAPRTPVNLDLPSLVLN